MLLLFSSSTEIRGGPRDGALPDLERTWHPWEGELYDFLQCRMALWIPSCCCKAESSLLAAGDRIGLTAEDDDDERLLPRCLRTSLNTLLPDGFSSFIGENTGAVAGDDDWKEEFSCKRTFSLHLLETLIYKGLIRFKYLCTTSFEKRFDGIWSWSRNFSDLNLSLKLWSLLSRELIVTSSISHFISFFSDDFGLVFWKPSIRTRNGDFGVFVLDESRGNIFLLLLKKRVWDE